MKNLLLFALMSTSVVTGKLLAQPPATEAEERMSIFTGWVGRWQGEGSQRVGPGEPKKSAVDERIEWKLDSTLLVVEGIGTTRDDATEKEMVVHHAFAVLSFDQQSDSYRFRSWLSNGLSTDAWFRVVGENKYQWGFDSPHGKMRYNISIDPVKKTWNETGEFSRDGNNWMKSFEMNLTKVD